MSKVSLSDLSEKQIKMIMDRTLLDRVIAERLGTSTSSISQYRNRRLKRMAENES